MLDTTEVTVANQTPDVLVSKNFIRHVLNARDIFLDVARSVLTFETVLLSTALAHLPITREERIEYIDTYDKVAKVLHDYLVKRLGIDTSLPYTIPFTKHVVQNYVHLLIERTQSMMLLSSEVGQLVQDALIAYDIVTGRWPDLYLQDHPLIFIFDVFTQVRRSQKDIKGWQSDSSRMLDWPITTASNILRFFCLEYLITEKEYPFALACYEAFSPVPANVSTLYDEAENSIRARIERTRKSNTPFVSPFPFCDQILSMQIRGLSGAKVARDWIRTHQIPNEMKTQLTILNTEVRKACTRFHFEWADLELETLF